MKNDAQIPPSSDDARDALSDSAYIAGAKAGWNCETSADLQRLIESRKGYLKPLIERRAAIAQSQPEPDDAKGASGG